MLASQVVSISELRTHWQKVLTSLAKEGSKYIFVNNKPKAVLLSCDEYEVLKDIADAFAHDPERTHVTPKNKAAYLKAKDEQKRGKTTTLEELKATYASKI
jgi:PHD/YefM family antitoxin component YafN of YafNO toxin-antitoxin module